MRTEEEAWDSVYEALRNAYSMAWDGCHKIYINMDRGQHEKMVGYGYGEDDSELVLTSEEAEDIELVDEWWDISCGLRFIHLVHTDQDGASQFEDGIAQFEFDEDEEEDDDE